jgi:uncharacterized membrane protein
MAVRSGCRHHQTRRYHPPIGDLARPVLLIHVLAAFVYGAGYIGTNVLTELARRTDDPGMRRHALHFSGVLDRLNMSGGSLAGITGVLTVFVFGYSLLTPWVIAAIAIYVVIVGTGIFFWGRIGREIDRAMLAGENARANALLRDPVNIAISRAENVLFTTLVALMVIRPGM